jgi:hypothetical protein
VVAPMSLQAMVWATMMPSDITPRL